MDRESELCYVKYINYVDVNLSQDYKFDNIYISHVKDLTLEEFIKARKIYCRLQGHGQQCYCRSLINAAEEIHLHNICQMAFVYKKHFNHLQYKSDKAVRQLMQLPVVVFPIKNKLFITEYSHGRDYKKLSKFIEDLVPENKCESLSKEEMKLLCSLASSEKDRKLIRVAATSGSSVSQSKAKFGIENISVEREAVYAAIKELKAIRNAIEELAVCKHSAFTDVLHVSEVDSCSDSDSDSCSDQTENICAKSQVNTEEISTNIPSFEELMVLLKKNVCNWISFVSECQLKFRDIEQSAQDKMLKDNSISI